MVWWPFHKKASDQQSQGNPQQANSFPNNSPVQSKTYYRSYSSSRTCKPDQEDPNFIICKEKVQDANDSYEKEERIPAKEYSNSVFNLSLDIPGSDAQFNEFFNQGSNMFRTAQNMFNMFDNFFPIHSPFHPQQRHEHFMPSPNAQQAQHQSQPQNKKQNPRYYFSTKNEADYSIKDL